MGAGLKRAKKEKGKKRKGRLVEWDEEEERGWEEM